MKKRIYVYELDCYKQASEEQIEKMHIRPDRYFDLEGLPTEDIGRLLEEFIWDRGKKLSPSSMTSEILYYNNIRDFLIDRNICRLDAKDEEKILLTLKGWMMEKGYALTSKKYRALYDKIGIETPGIVKHMKKILKFAQEDDDRDEQEKDIWNLKNFDFPIQSNPILNMETINFTKITQPDIREEVKKAVFMHLKYSPLGTVQSEMTAIKRFAKFLEKRCPDIKSLQELERLHIEQYLIYLQTEAHERKNYRSDLYALRRLIETTYIFVKKDEPTKPYQYSMIQNQIMKMIRQEDIRDDNGELLRFGTHIFRHCYGKKLTEMHVDDWMIAKLLGHTTTLSVHYYRKIGNKLMADETRGAREKMDRILLDIIEGWDDYEI